MSNILIRDVPEDLHANLQQKAQQRHQSLQQFLTEELQRVASRVAVIDVLNEIETREGGRVGLEQAVRDIAEARDRR